MILKGLLWLSAQLRLLHMRVESSTDGVEFSVVVFHELLSGYHE